MPVHTKTRPINSSHRFIRITLEIPGNKEASFTIPDTPIIKKKLDEFKKLCREWAKDITPWHEATPWENLAADRIAQHSKAGLALRGARYRENISQKKLAKLCGISQENLSRMENGKRVIGEKVAKKLAKVLHIDYQLLVNI
jgi:ribosome-binding protein aMBF1 (putative translation factor)